ncbi:hypothetical protein JRQ81_019295, partial [Phrynocephalus forsythii]
CQDPCRTPLIRRAIKGWERKTPKRQDNRKPITPPILRALLGELAGICWSSYEVRLFRCVFTLAFFGAFRVGAVMQLWIVGHGIVYWAGVWAKQSHWGQHLGMEEHVCITWFGNRGMHWGDLLPGLWMLFRQHGAPHGLVVQLGENDIASSRGIDLKKEMEASLLVLHSTYPDVALFWSQLLQRRHWQGAGTQEGLNCFKGSWIRPSVI